MRQFVDNLEARDAEIARLRSRVAERDAAVKRARAEALMTAEMIASDFAGEIWDAMRPQAHEAVEVVEARIAALRTGDTAEGGSHGYSG